MRRQRLVRRPGDDLGVVFADRTPRRGTDTAGSPDRRSYPTVQPAWVQTASNATIVPSPSLTRTPGSPGRRVVERHGPPRRQLAHPRDDRPGRPGRRRRDAAGGRGARRRRCRPSPGRCRSGIRRSSLGRRRDDPPATRPRAPEGGGARPSRRAPPRRSPPGPGRPALRTTRRSADTGSSVGSVVDEASQPRSRSVNRPPVPARASVSQPNAYGRSGP